MRVQRQERRGAHFSAARAIRRVGRSLQGTTYVTSLDFPKIIHDLCSICLLQF